MDHRFLVRSLDLKQAEGFIAIFKDSFKFAEILSDFFNYDLVYNK